MGIEEDLFRALRLRPNNIHGNRTVNAANAIDPQDYVTLTQLRNGLSDPSSVGVDSATRNTSVGFKRAYNFAYTGNLFITSSLTPVITTSINSVASNVLATVELAPVDADITIKVYQDASLWATITILDGNTSGTIAPPGGTITTGKKLIVELTTVGTTFPGANFMLNIDTTAV